MENMGILKKAENQMAFFKAGFLGFPGSGKTYTASLLAIGICESVKNNKVAFYDTETGSDFLLPKFNEVGIEVFQVKSRSFSDLLETIRECEKENIGVLIVDSITHVWRDLCDSYDKKLQRRGRLQFQDWAIIKGEWKKYTDLYVNSNLHLIVCGRAGYEYDYDFNEDGTKDLIKTDIKMKVESEFGFEPSLVVLMERTSENKEEIKEHLGKTDRKSKEAKQTHKPTCGSKWIHRAYVLKDRTDTLNGQTFDYPTFKDFLPHFKALNIGGQHLGVDTSRDSSDRFDSQGRPEWKKEQEQKKIALDTIQGWLTSYFPGSTVSEKKAKIGIIKHVFGRPSWEYVCGLKNDEIQTGLKRIESILKIETNIPILMGEQEGILEEQQDMTELPKISKCPLDSQIPVTPASCEKCQDKTHCEAGKSVLG